MSIKSQKKNLRLAMWMKVAPERIKRRKETKCFWTWRFGHVYSRTDGDYKICGICGCKTDVD